MVGGRTQEWPFRRKVGVALLALLALAAVLLAIPLAPLLLERNHYAGVPSIEAGSTYRDPALMRAAWALPNARRYRALPYEFQHNQSVCGPTSIADVLRSMGRPASQEEVLAHSPRRPWFGYLLGGLTLDQAGGLLARTSGHPAQVMRGLDLAAFRAQMRLLNDPRRRVIANFHRGPLFGRGHGHFSPLLGYLADRDLVLVGDVNPAFRPFLVSSERLWRAVDTTDSDTGKRRGLIILTV